MNIGWVILIIFLLLAPAIIFGIIFSFENMKWLIA